MKDTPDTYKTIHQQTLGEFKDRGSKFIAYLFPVKTAEIFEQKLAEIKAAHPKARHHCFAYRLLDDNEFRYNDDGEPSGTAGKPIYNQLIKAELRNVACVVVRYFGGTKLGTSGLINAYRESTAAAIGSNEPLETYQKKILKIEFDYAIMGPLLNVVKQLDFTFRQKDFESQPFIEILVRKSQWEEAVRAIKAALLGRPVEDIEEETEVEGLRFLPGRDV